MNLISARRISVAGAVTSAVLGVAALSGSAVAAPAASTNDAASPAGYSPVEICTSLAGQVTITPGLVKKGKIESAVITGTLDGCTLYGQSQPGQGTFTAHLSGTASTTAGSLAGTWVANWPASSGLNPSSGSMTLNTTSLDVYSFGGSTTSGAFVGSLLQGAYLVTSTQGTGTKHNPITQQTFVNTAPLQILVNFG